MNEADRQFIEWVRGYVKWYERASNRWARALGVIKLFSLVASVITIVLASAITKDFFATWGKSLIIAATVLATVSSELLAQLQVRKMEALREEGRLETEHLLQYTWDKFDEFSGDRAKIHQIKDEVRERIRLLEQTQHRQFVDINSGTDEKARRKGTSEPIAV